MVAVAASAFGHVHGGVGNDQQLVCRMRMGRIQGDADAGTQCRMRALKVVGFADRRYDFVCDVRGFLGIRVVGQEQHKLIAAQASYQVGSAHAAA